MATERYNPRASEPKWQKAWDEEKLFEARNDDPRPKYYVLEMFPYPSGRIHMGHVRNYTMGDVVARYRRAKGFNVLHPMGWDAFGLPAENAATREQGPSAGLDLRQHRHDARASSRSMGLSLDWAREFATCDADYYHHQQKLFLDFWRAGLVDAQIRQGQLGPGRHDRARQRAGDRRPRLALRRAGRAARADAVVLQDHRLWRRTLLDGLDGARPLAGKGPADAAELDRPLRGPADPLAARAGTAPAGESELEVYTTRPDTIFGASFMAIAADHPLARKAAADQPGAGQVHRRGPPYGHLAGGAGDGREEGLRHRHPRRPSVRSRAGRCRSMSPISC